MGLRAQGVLWAPTSSDFILNKMGRAGEKVLGAHNLVEEGREHLKCRRYKRSPMSGGLEAVSHLVGGGRALHQSRGTKAAIGLVRLPPAHTFSSLCTDPFLPLCLPFPTLPHSPSGLPGAR